jgi:hypothetical protein
MRLPFVLTYSSYFMCDCKRIMGGEGCEKPDAGHAFERIQL